ncbi:hypothetical protein C5C18_11920 [Rathayibacter tritici]|uniref:hypothetical protein n=1 Tax=Rathayibacter tritici TaxID=33888 RepID=UPI000CE9341F|nr:hypothetical protein [Rathayibacter tritici]PPF66148.1 hypothetical protein C5C21_09675 [Rathayibacter tritici]PPG05987.1 hypothetical protein C5C18_11920 [Rathayibacter tritici]
MKFRGQVLSVTALLELPSDQGAPRDDVPDLRVMHTAASNARHAAQLIAEGEPPDVAWRFGILQTLDDYSSTVKRGGVALGLAGFSDVPAPTAASELDAAFAALADHLAERDGWEMPAWAGDPERRIASWYPDVPSIFREEAEQDSPRAFRERGILITGRTLARA